MTEQQAEAQEAEVTEADDTDDDGGGEDAAIITEAREGGWVPKDQWRGPEEAWKPAKEFVEKGRELAPFLSRQNKQLKGELAALKSEHSVEFGRIAKMHERAMTTQRQSIERDFRGLKRKAVELGDTKSFDAAERDEAKALKTFDDEVAKADEKPTNGAASPAADQAVVQTFWSANPKIRNSPMLRGAADELWQEVSGDMPDAPINEKLAEVKARVQEQFPDRFPGQKKNGRAAAVEGAGARSLNGGDSGSQWAKVPKDARASAERHIMSERLFDPPGAERDQPLTPAQKKQAQEAWAGQYFA